MTSRKLLLLAFLCGALTVPFAPSITHADDISTARITTVAARDSLSRTVEEAIDTVSRRYLDTSKHSPWQVMHGLLGMRYGFKMMHNGKLTNGLKWMTSGQSFDGQSWFEKTQYGGRAHGFTRAYAFQGHDNQFLAVISMAGVPLKYKIKTNKGETITVGDMVENAKAEISDEDELTWTLWALSRYLPPDAEWTNKNGELWSIEKIISKQVKKPISNAIYCGGTHSLFAMSHARNVYLRHGNKLRGPWLEADLKIRRHVELVKEQQNADGMFSTNFFMGKAYETDFSKRLASSGHLLEFLMIALSQKQLKERWVRKGVQAVSRDLIRNSKAEAKCGPLYHATNGLVIYMDRTEPRRVRKMVEMNPEPDPVPQEQVANVQRKQVVATPVTSRDNMLEISTVAEPSRVQVPATAQGLTQPAVREFVQPAPHQPVKTPVVEVKQLKVGDEIPLPTFEELPAPAPIGK